MKKIEIGHTNDSYKDGDSFLQYKNKNGLNHLSNNKIISKLDFVPNLMEDNEEFSKWEWIDGENLNNPTKEDLINLAKTLKKLHNSKMGLSKFNLKRRINTYRKIINTKGIKIEIIERLYRKINKILKNMNKNVPIHADLYKYNIIKTKENKLYFVDWEYSHMGDIHFELAYIIEAYEFDDEQKNIFLDSYGDYDPYILKKHFVLVNYLTVLWACAQDKLPFSIDNILKRLEILEKECF